MWNVQPFPFKTYTQFLVNPPLRGFSYMNSTSKAAFDKKAFEKKAFKFVPYLIVGKIIFAAWFIRYLVKL